MIPARTSKTPSRRSGSALLGALLLVATILLVGIVALQVIEWMHYSASPSVWAPQ